MNLLDVRDYGKFHPLTGLQIKRHKINLSLSIQSLAQSPEKMQGFTELYKEIRSLTSRGFKEFVKLVKFFFRVFCFFGYYTVYLMFFVRRVMRSDWARTRLKNLQM